MMPDGKHRHRGQALPRHAEHHVCSLRLALCVCAVHFVGIELLNFPLDPSFRQIAQRVDRADIYDFSGVRRAAHLHHVARAFHVDRLHGGILRAADVHDARAVQDDRAEILRYEEKFLHRAGIEHVPDEDLRARTRQKGRIFSFEHERADALAPFVQFCAQRAAKMPRRARYEIDRIFTFHGIAPPSCKISDCMVQ